MAGKPGNPNHDPQTGKFTSASGLNVDNSTATQRIGGRIKMAGKAALGFGIGVAGVAAEHLFAAALQGAAKPIREHTEAKTAKFIAKNSPKIEKAALKQSKAVISAVRKMDIGGSIKSFARPAPPPVVKPPTSKPVATKPPTFKPSITPGGMKKPEYR